MHEQSKLVSGRLSELQQEANSEKAAHEFERKIVSKLKETCSALAHSFCTKQAFEIRP